MIPYHFWPPLSEIVTQVKKSSITARAQVVRALDLAKNEILGSNVSPTFISLHAEEALLLADRIDSQILD